MRYVLLLLFPILAVGSAGVQAQDSHYWTNQWGTRADLLGGAVVGSVKDLSAIYYNPGAVAFSRDERLVLATDAVDLTRIELESGAGPGVDLSSLQAATAPSIFALRLAGIDIIEGDEIAVSIMTRHDFRLNVEGRRITNRDVLPGEPGDESFAAEVFSDQRMYEAWLGFSWAKKLEGRDMAFGVTQFIAVRTQRTRTQAVAQAVAAGGEGAATVQWDEYSYYNSRLLWKVGALWRRDNVGVGLAITTPSWDLFGRGRSNFNASAINLDPENTGNPVSALAANYQKDLRARYKSGWAVAAGASYELGATSLYATAEWFDAVRRFTVIDPSDFTAQTTGETISTRIDGAARTVTNVGVGVEHEVSDRTTLYGAVTTDFSFNVPENGLSSTNWDIYHVTAGGAVLLGGVDLTLGLTHGRGSRESQRLADLQSNAGASADLQGSGDTVRAKYRRWKLVFGVTAHL